MLNDQAQFLKGEVEQYRGLVDKLQSERDAMSRREKEVLLKAEARGAARRASAIADARAAELETKLLECMADRDTLQFRLGEAKPSSGRIINILLLSSRICTVMYLCVPNHESNCYCKSVCGMMDRDFGSVG